MMTATGLIRSGQRAAGISAHLSDNGIASARPYRECLGWIAIGVLCGVLAYTLVGVALAQVVPVPHVHAEYESRFTAIETNHRTFMVMAPIVLGVFAAILGVMWKATQLDRNKMDALELKHSNALTAVTIQLTAVKDSVDRIEKLISDTVLFGSGLRPPSP